MKPALCIFKDVNLLHRKAAGVFTKTAINATTERGRFLVALSGGNTPLQLYRLLAEEPYRKQIEWSRVHVFWGDERCVPPDDPENSYGQARKVLLDQVSIPAEGIHRIRSELEPAAAAIAYAHTLKEFASNGPDWPRFDLVLLGMGEDGHTASLFPGSEVNVPSPVLPVTAKYQDRPANRVTLTPLVFNSARQIIFLVAGRNKAKILSQVLGDAHDPVLYPVQRIHPLDGTVTWLMDEDAASMLPSELRKETCEEMIWNSQ